MSIPYEFYLIPNHILPLNPAEMTGISIKVRVGLRYFAVMFVTNVNNCPEPALAGPPARPRPARPMAGRPRKPPGRVCRRAVAMTGPNARGCLLARYPPAGSRLTRSRRALTRRSSSRGYSNPKRSASGAATRRKSAPIANSASHVLSYPASA